MYYINELRVPTGIHDVASIVDSVTKINLGVVYKPGNGSGAVLVMGPPCVEVLGELTVKALGKSEEFWEKMKVRGVTKPAWSSYAILPNYNP